MIAPLWTRDEAVAVTGGHCPVAWQATGISIDSRQIAKGDLFVALAGPNFDGHDFIAKALDRGAAAALGHRRPEGLDEAAPLLLVEDSLEGLTALGRAGRDRSPATVIAVTGSVGKTSTKEMLAAALDSAGKSFASAASHNNHWGVPLSLARLPRDARFGIFEVGMNHPGEIRTLVALVRPQVAMVTQIAPAHLEFFPSGLAGIAEAKAEIFEGPAPGGTAVINRDAPEAERLIALARKNAARVLTFGRHAKAEVRLVSLELDANGSRLEVDAEGEGLSFALSLPGAHMATNAVGVLAACRALEVELGPAAAALAALKPLKGRGAHQRLTLAGGTVELIDDSYNANPTSVAAALAVLGHAAVGRGGRRIAVLGDMLELGSESEVLHVGLAREIEANGIDLVFCCGTAMQALWRALPSAKRGAHAPDSAALAPLLLAALKEGDIVLVKGSLGSRMARVVEALTTPRAA